ncbi:MAG: type pilus assembly protein PilA [Fimbriimonadaceae bacterium]|jgi:type II secretory pathway pseudopilin PulG|nr:type pilus assembly protein PilA [Fimbriimonadaceae bacterium]
MIVVMIISILLGIAMPNFLRSRALAKGRSCAANLRQINAAKEQLAMAGSLQEGDSIASKDLMPYLHDKNFPSCASGGLYTVGTVGQNPICSIGTSSNPPHVLSPTS